MKTTGNALSDWFKAEVRRDGKPERYNYAGYAAQAGTNVMGNISIRF